MLCTYTAGGHGILFGAEVKILNVFVSSVTEGHVIKLDRAILTAPNEKTGMLVDGRIYLIGARALCDHLAVAGYRGNHGFFGGLPFEGTVINLI